MDKVKEILLECLVVDELDESKTLYELGAESLDLLQLTFEIEKIADLISPLHLNDTVENVLNKVTF